MIDYEKAEIKVGFGDTMIGVDTDPFPLLDVHIDKWLKKNELNIACALRVLFSQRILDRDTRDLQILTERQTP